MTHSKAGLKVAGFLVLLFVVTFVACCIFGVLR